MSPKSQSLIGRLRGPDSPVLIAPALDREAADHIEALERMVALLTDAAQAALDYHGVMLTSMPPQSAWDYHRVSDRLRTALNGATPHESFQERVRPWMMECFGQTISADKVERNHRFLEEALELVQACGCTECEALQLVNYVYGRPDGEIKQEVGGVMVTLAALCLAQGIGMDECGETELARIWTKVPQIRAKQASKPKQSPLPGDTPKSLQYDVEHPNDGLNEVDKDKAK